MAIFSGGAGNDSLTGGTGNDLVDGGAGDDRLSGGAGADTLVGGAGNDRLDGGAGFDLLDYSAAAAAVTVNLGSGLASGGAGSDQLFGFEKVLGSSFADSLIGGRLSAWLAGGGGNDGLTGGDMQDTLDGGAGNDTLTGGSGNDLYIVQDAGDRVVERDGIAPVLVSTGSAGQGLVGASDQAAISAGGRFVVFGTEASAAAGTAGAAAGGGPAPAEVFVKDLQTGALLRVASDAAGAPADADSWFGVLSADGRFVAFDSEADNLVAGDTNAAFDVFVKDLQTGAIQRASIGSAGLQGNDNSYSAALSGDGRLVVFNSTAPNLAGADGQPQLLARDLDGAALLRVSANAAGTWGNGLSEGASVSADGSRVAFVSEAGNLLAGAATTGRQAFVKNLDTGAVTLVSGSAAGVQGNAVTQAVVMAGNGVWAAFASDASNLVAGDSNGQRDIFVKNLDTGGIARVSTTAGGAQASGGGAADPFISADGRFVVFSSSATNLVAGDGNGVSDVFVKDLQTQAIARLSVDAAGAEGQLASLAQGISADGLHIVLRSASVLEAGDANGVEDVVVVINPLLASGGGVDTVQASVTTTLAANVEHLVLTGSAAINGSGNGLANAITGNAGSNALAGAAGNDTLSGGAGNDSLDGGSGLDSLVGGTGSDRYSVDNAGDVINEAGTGAGEVDSVLSSVSWVLGGGLENLTLVGSAVVNGSGNGLANVITGNSGSNTLTGAAGNDSLIGGAGNDSLDGGSGIDSLTGGAGNDRYTVDNVGDVINETGTGVTEVDSVSASVSWTLGNHLERLTLTGGAHVSGTGNGLANSITGNTGNNHINGGAGNDTLAGGAGLDTFRFSSALNAASNVDTVNGFVPADDRIELENGVFLKLTTVGALPAANFLASASGTAADANDFVLYETDTGKLFFDADGSGAAAAVHVATFSGLPLLTSADFFVT